MLEYEGDVDHVDRSGRTPLLAAASMGHAAVVERLLFWGCYVDHIDAEGRTVLSVAAAQGSQVRQLTNTFMYSERFANIIQIYLCIMIQIE